MTRPPDDRLLAFLEGEMDEAERTRLLGEIEADPDLARDLRQAARGLAAVHTLAEAPAPAAQHTARPEGRRISPWWAVAAAAVALLVSVPATLWLSPARGPASPGFVLAPGELPTPAPAFVLVLHGRWPDAATVGEEEQRRRAVEYWTWASTLAEASVLEAAGDLRQEPGRRLGPNGVPVAVAADIVDSPDFVVGMFALDVASYDEAVAIARECPHLRYGGSVSVRQVGRRFVTTAAGAM